ncbi:MAG: pyridoxamine 5'-phosphate oxidase family protein [Thermoanaerobaculia bacterium]
MGQVMTAEQVENRIGLEMFARLGCYAEGKVYVVPITYAYENGVIYSIGGEGMKMRMMRKNPEVCLEIEHLEGPEDWETVIAWGRFEELTGDDARHGLELFIRRVTPPGAEAKKEQPAGPPPLVYRIILGEKTGRYESASTV